MARSKQRSSARRWLARFTALVLVVGASMFPGASVAAAEPTDMVLVWNTNAINVIGAPTAPPVTDPPTAPGLGQGPPISPLHLAMVHGAVYDAVNAIDGRHKPYLATVGTAPATASKAAAVAQAAHDVLIGITPSTATLVIARIDAMLDASLLLIDNGQAKTDGRAIGAKAALEMLRARIGDGRFGSYTWQESTAVGKWRSLATGGNAFGWYAKVKPLTMKSTGQFRTAGPLSLTSAQYAAEFNEVKALGAQSGSSRTAAQTLLAAFTTANPLPYMNRGLREIAAAKGLSTSDQALLFVKTSMASADGLIGCFDDKDHWNFWRPQTAIRNAASDGNPATSPDADWVSLFFPPPGYSDHPSGYNCYTGALWHSARLFFGTDKVSFQLSSPGVPLGSPVAVAGSTRSYTRFTGVIRDTINGRILNGFHFRTADVQGARLGKKVAQWVDKRFFQPVD